MRTMPAEVTPANLFERTSVLVFMFIAFSVFATCISQLTTTYMKINGQNREFEDDMALLKVKLRSRRVDAQLASIVRDFMKYQFSRKRGLYMRDGYAIKNLGHPNIQSVVNFALWGPLLKKLAFCEDCMLSNEMLRSVFEKATSDEDYPSNQVICTAGCVATECIIVVDGELKVHGGDLNGPIQIVNEHCLLTEDEVFSDTTVTTKTCVQVLKVRKEALFLSCRRHGLIGDNGSWLTQHKPRARLGSGTSCVGAYD